MDARLGLIGADRYFSAGFYCRKIFKTKDRGLFGCSGDDRPIARFENWLLHDGDPPDQIPDSVEGEEFHAIQLHKGAIFHWGAAMRGVLVDGDYFAIGAGGDLAIGVMDTLNELGYPPNILLALSIAAHRADGTKPPFEFMDEAGTIYPNTPPICSIA